MENKRSFWKKIFFALVSCPLVWIVGIIFFMLAGAVDDFIVQMQGEGKWWILLIISFVFSLIYFLFDLKIRLIVERRK